MTSQSNNDVTAFCDINDWRAASNPGVGRVENICSACFSGRLLWGWVQLGPMGRERAPALLLWEMLVNLINLIDQSRTPNRLNPVVTLVDSLIGASFSQYNYFHRSRSFVLCIVWFHGFFSMLNLHQ